GLAVSGDLLAVEIDDHHHVRRHVPLRHALRRRQDAVVGEADGDVAVVAGAVAARVEALADLDDVGAEAIQIGHQLAFPCSQACWHSGEQNQAVCPFRAAVRARPSTTYGPKTGSLTMWPMTCCGGRWVRSGATPAAIPATKRISERTAISASSRNRISRTRMIIAGVR